MKIKQKNNAVLHAHEVSSMIFDVLGASTPNPLTKKCEREAKDSEEYGETYQDATNDEYQREFPQACESSQHLLTFRVEDIGISGTCFL